MPDSFSLSGKHALITGGTRGIGLAIADSYLRAGAKVTICSRKQAGVDAALAELKDHGDNVFGTTAHVGKAEEIGSLIERARDQFGPIGILVNNAGTNPYYGPILDSTDEAWDKTMDVNLRGPYILSREVAKGMVAGDGGSIVNISSIAGLATSPGQGIYSVTKAALIMLTKTMAKELGRQGVRVNAICPGVVKTRLSEAMWKDPQIEQHMASLKALGRVGTTDEITGAALYFASPASSFTTGAVLVVDGGMII